MIDSTAHRTCTIERSDHRFCERPALAEAPFPICSHHALRIFRHMADLLDSVDPLVRLRVGFDELDDRRARRYREEVAKATEAAEVVYYLLIDGLVKIGYASDLTKRLAAYPPTARLLGTELGSLVLERERHAEFAEYLEAGREWFAPGPRLRAHIEGLADYRAA